jgi:DNA-binding Lrp family transcriptional regulator
VTVRQRTRIESFALAQENFSRNERKIIDFLSIGPRNCWEIERALDLSHQTASSRVTDLARRGIIRETGTRRPTGSGRMAAVMELVPASERIPRGPDSAKDRKIRALEETLHSAMDEYESHNGRVVDVFMPRHWSIRARNLLRHRISS